MDATWINGLNDLQLQTDTMMLGALVALILPLAFAIILRKAWSSETKGLVAFGLCLPVALIVAAATGKITRESDVASAVLPVIAITFFIYHTFWKPSGIAPAVEDKTG